MDNKFKMTKDHKPDIKASLSQQRATIEDILESVENGTIIYTPEQLLALKAIQYNLILMRKAQKKNAVSVDLKRFIV
jgi:hypothetical protein